VLGFAALAACACGSARAQLAPNAPTEAIGTSSPIQTATISFSGSFTLGAVSFVTQGATGLDFNAAAGGTCVAGNSYTAGSSCTVNYTFTPKFSGFRYGAAVATDTTGAVAGTAYLFGTGTGPQMLFYPGTVSTVATAAASGFKQLAAVAVDGNGNVYVSDDGGQQVLKETPNGSGGYTQTVVANLATSGVLFPNGIAVDGAGNVYFADSNNNNLVKETPTASGYVQSFVATASANGLSNPYAVAVDGDGNVYIADSGNSRILLETYSAGSYTQSVVVNFTGQPTSTGAYAVAVDGAGNVYVADELNNQILKETLTGSGYTQSVVVAGLNGPYDVEVDGNGNVYVADEFNDRVLKEVLSGGTYTQLVLADSTEGISAPDGIAIEGDRNVYVSNGGNNSVQKLDFVDAPTLTFASAPVYATSGDSPQTVTLANVGNAVLDFSIPSAGTNPSISPSFTVNTSGSGDCASTASGASSPATLGAVATCALPISFTPQTIGTITGSAVLTDNNLNANNATQTILLDGVGVAIAPTIVFTVPNHTYGDPPFTVVATSNSTGAITYSVLSGPATISGATVTITGPGTVTLLATQAAAGIYRIGTQMATFAVAKEPQTITFVPPASPVPYTVGPITLVASASSGLPVTFSVLSGAGSVSGNTLTVMGGTIVVAADQPGNTYYAAAPEVTETIVVKGATALALTTTSSSIFINNTVTLSAAVTSLYDTPSGTVALSGAGVAAITVSFPAVAVHSITAVYNGDTLDFGSTGSAITETVMDFSIDGSGFSSQNVVHGSTVTYTFVVSPVGGTAMPSAISFSLAGYPYASVVTFAPQPMPAGSGTATITLTLQTPDYPTGSAANQQHAMRMLALLSLGALLLPFGRRFRGLMLAVVLLAGAGALTGCGSGWNHEDFNMTLTGTSGLCSHAITAPLRIH